MFWLRFHELLLDHLKWGTVNLTTLNLLEQEPTHTIETISRYVDFKSDYEHSYSIKTCPKCGYEYCYACAGNTNVDQEC